MAFVRALFGFIITIAVLIFASANLHTIEVFYSPFTPSIELPLYLIALGLMGFGFVTGGILVWINEGKARKERRRQRKEIKTLQKELSAVNENGDTKSPPSDFFPALPKAFKK